MKILWLDINSSYSHSSVALPAIHAQVSYRDDWEWTVVRGTINDNPSTLAAEVAQLAPDVIAATFWLFTHRMQIEVLSRAVALLGQTEVVCGGPEFLGDNEQFLRNNPFVSAVIRGEGEQALPEFLNSINDRSSWGAIEGLCWIGKDDYEYHDNGIARVMDFASLKYPEESRFFNWDKPFVQLETTRGCFNTCAFCVSGGEKPVRYQTMDQVRSRLKTIHSHGIRDIRVLDRTFNYDTVRACDMLDLFTEYDGQMRFHLEIHPSLLTDVLKNKISSLPEGLLHLEAGIQSLDKTVLAQSGRKGSLESSVEGLGFLCSSSNVQTHADLIAGLPSYSLDMLCNDISKLIELSVDELQVESLKVLPGTKMRNEAEATGLRYSPLPPYEVLATPVMSPSELRYAMQISRMLDLYYNSPVWQKVIRSLIVNNDGFIRNFTDYLKEKMMLDSPVSLERRGLVLFEYCRKYHPGNIGEVSIAWIQAGFSLKKEPAGSVVKIKHIDSFVSENDLSIVYGNLSTSNRYYLVTTAEIRVLFGYDAEQHQSSPVFMATLNSDV